MMSSKPTARVPPLPMEPDPPKFGFAGLANLGNTCFMNVIIQMLANTSSLKEFLMGIEYQRDINRDNKHGSRGKLVIAFAMIIRKLWSQNQSFSPLKLKEVMAELHSEFAGFAQHDAQEFLGFLLDGLHEDLNRVKMKVNGDSSSENLPMMNSAAENLSDEEAAKEAWSRFKAHSDSFIVDHFQGLFRSKLECPGCGEVSVTFDSYSSVQVPIPKHTAKIPVMFFPKHSATPRKPPVKMMLDVPTNCKLRDIGEELASRTGVKSRAHFEFIEVENHKPEPVSYLNAYRYTSSKPLYVFEVEAPSYSGEEITTVYCMQRALPSKVRPAAQECAHCHKRKSEGTAVKWCARCYTAGFCSRECQTKAWPEHKTHCKTLGPEPLGQPFVVSMPTSELTYRTLSAAMQSYAQYSVNCFQRPSNSSASTNSSTSTNSSASTNSSTSTNPSASTNAEEGTRAAGDHTTTESLFFIKPLNSKFAPLVADKGSRLSDTGDAPLNLTTTHLSMDWKNCGESAVGSKPLEYEVDDKQGSLDEESEHLTGLERCLNLFSKTETLSAEDCWQCPKCKTMREAEKQMSIWSLPNILIIQLKRFSYRNAYWRDKMDDFVSYPISGLDMSRFCKGPITLERPIYDLYGVVNHHGSLLGGHYTAYARSLNKDNSTEVHTGWRLMDDSAVSSVTDENAIVNKSAYVLFYQRRSFLSNFNSASEEFSEEYYPASHDIPSAYETALGNDYECAPHSEQYYTGQPGSDVKSIIEARPNIISSTDSLEKPVKKINSVIHDEFDMEHHTHMDQKCPLTNAANNIYASANLNGSTLSGAHSSYQSHGTDSTSTADIGDILDKFTGVDPLDTEFTDMYALDTE